MNVAAIVQTALTSLSLTIYNDASTGNPPDSYIVWNYSDERPAVRADDTDILDSTTIQVHYFTRLNPETNKKAIRRLLRASGFTIINTSQFYESDTGYRHVVVEAWIEGIIND